MHVREAAPDDFAAFMKLYRQLQPADPVLTNGADRAAFDQILAHDHLTLFVLERDGAVVATTYLNVMPNISRSASPYAVIENVVVDDTMRNQGLGQHIMRATVEAAWAAGCYKVMLQTGSKRESTHAFYRACGLQPDVKTAYVAWRPTTEQDGA